MGESKRALIATFNRSRNFGAMLQSYALQQKLQELGVASEHLDRYVPQAARHFSLKQWLKDLRNRRANLLFQSFQDDYLHYTEKKYRTSECDELKEEYTHFIAGSDQVWNCKNGIIPEFFLEFAGDENKRISYAASIGLSKLPEEHKERFKEAVEKFQRISVREKTGAELVRAIIGKNVETVLDPVFLLPVRTWERILVPPKDSGYIFVYGFDVSDRMKEYIKELRNRTKKRVISVYRLKGMPVNRVVGPQIGPLEFLGYVHNADYIVTSSFHCTAFSLIFQKKMIVDHHGTTGSRTKDLLVSVQYPETPPLNKLDQWISEKVDYQTIQVLLDQQIEKSAAFLKEAIT